MTGPEPRPLNFGTIPTLAGLGLVCAFEGTAGYRSVRALYDEMVRLKTARQWDELRRLLALVGFAWRPSAPVLTLLTGGAT